jgi:predicted glutamine amidotransferase
MRVAVCIGFLLCLLLVPVVAQGDECRLLMMVAQSSNGVYSGSIANAMDIMQSEEAAHGGNGWGISYFDNGCDTTGVGWIWQQNANVNMNGRRWADYQPISQTTHLSTALGQLNLHNVHLLCGHIRQASPGTPTGIADPHPFLYRTNNRTFTGAFNGTVSATALSAMSTFVTTQNDSNDWNDQVLTYLSNPANQGDSGVYFAYLIANIRISGWDVMRGLHDALANPGVGGSWNRNFVFTDGYDAYTYRYSIDNDHPLEYCVIDPVPNQPNGSRCSVIMSQATNGQHELLAVVEGSERVLENDELLYAPLYGRNTSIFQFSTAHQLRQAYDLAPVVNGQDQNYYVWRGFPILDPDPDVTAAMTLTQIVGSGVGFDLANEVLGEGNHDWPLVQPGVWGGPEESFTRDRGYKIHIPDWDPEVDPPLVQGDLIEPFTTTTLTPGIDNWVNYWLMNSQILRGALSCNVLRQIKYVKSQRWAYFAPEVKPDDDEETRNLPEGITTTTNRPMEFGNMYVIRLKDTVTQSVELQWLNSREAHPYLMASANPTHFTYTEAPDYEVIDIYEVDPGVTEVGVFAGTTCVGAVAVPASQAVQMLAYTQGFEGIPLHFEYYTGERSAVSCSPAFSVYLPKLGCYVSTTLTAGSVGHTIIRMGAGEVGESVPSASKLSLQIAPNPMNPVANISLDIGTTGFTTLDVFDVRGRKVTTLMREELPAGKHTVVWDGTDDQGRKIATGVYLCRLRSGEATAMSKLLLLK